MIQVFRGCVPGCVLLLSGMLGSMAGGITPARAACDSPAAGVSLDCSVTGVTAVRIEGAILPAAGTIFLSTDGVLSVLNAGVLELGPVDDLENMPVGDRLVLNAKRISYVGDGARLESNGGFSINATVEDSATSRFELRDHFAGTSGLSVNSWGTGDVEIVLGAGEVDVSDIGMQVSADAGAVRIELAEGTWIDAAHPIQILGTAETHVVLAGELRNPEGAIDLGDGDTLLELRPGYAVEGTLNAMAGSNSLVWGGSGSAGFDLSEIGGKYLGFQSFAKHGSGSWTLSGTAAEPLGITVHEGTLLLAGTLDTDDTTTVLDGARIGGDGRFGTIDVWGTLAPGLELGTLYGGEVIFQEGSLLEIEVTAEGGDRLEAGRATLGGATVRVVPRALPVSGMPSPHVFLVTSEELGAENRFLGVESASSRFAAALSYSSHDVAVSLTPTGKSFADFARSEAERAIAERLDALGEAAPLYPALDQMSDAELEAMLAQLAGAELPASARLAGEPAGLLGPAALGRVQQAGAGVGGGPLGYAPDVASLLDPQPVNLWGRVVTSLGDTGGTKTGTTMVLAGVDSLVQADWSFGALLGFGGSAMTSGETRSQAASLSAALYGARPLGPLTLRFVGGGTLSAVQSRRQVSGPGVYEVYTGSYPALGVHLLAELAAPLQIGPLSAELFADAGFSGVQTAGYSESGGPAALTVSAGWSQAVDLSAGLRVSHALALGTTLARLDGTLALTHRFATAATMLHSFAGSDAFAVAGPEEGGSGLLAGLSLHLDLDGTGLVDLGYAFSLRPASSVHTLSARFVRPL